MNWSIFWASLSAMAAIVAAVVAVSAEMRARKSESHSKDSADAAKRSADIADDALKFSKEEAERQRVERAIDKAVEIGKERGSWQKGLQSLINGHPDLATRDDFPEICRPFFVALGVSTNSLKDAFEAFKKDGILTTVPSNWIFKK